MAGTGVLTSGDRTPGEPFAEHPEPYGCVVGNLKIKGIET